MNDDAEQRAKVAERKHNWRSANREKARAIALKFAHSEKGKQHRKKWRDTHPENIRANTARYRAKMTPEKRKQVAKKHRDKPLTKLKSKLKEAAKRAAKRGLAFDERLFDVVLSNPPTHCACCTIALDYAAEGRGCRNRSPSIDRVINADGYTIENTRFVCGRCNALKSDATLEEILAIAAYMQRHLGS